MEYRRLGSSGMYVSEITYDNGITTFDTADVYAGTRAETVLGKALKGVKRESYELLTKVYWPTGTGKNDRGLSRKHIIESVNASLKRLKTEHIDLYQMHRFDFETPLEESLSAFDDLIRQGKVFYIGFSEWTSEQIQAALKIQDARGYTRFVSSQPQYSMLWRVIESEVVPTCQANGIGQIVWSPIAQG
ncbi:MAG: aldo/keto reductase, partial [Actinobacteria bacterium]|nr:aldo/keto reductase [Actinomycetota bacterium]